MNEAEILRIAQEPDVEGVCVSYSNIWTTSFHATKGISCSHRLFLT